MRSGSWLRLAAHHIAAGSAVVLVRASPYSASTSHRAPKATASIHRHVAAQAAVRTSETVTATAHDGWTTLPPRSWLTSQATARPSGMNWLSNGSVR